MALLLQQKPGGRLLEIGSGAGGFLELAATRYEVYGIDVSPHAAKGLPSELEGRVVVGDIEKGPLPAGTFDVIVALNVLEHLRRPALLLEKVRDALAPDGVFFGSMPCNAGLIGSAHTAITDFFDRTHVSSYPVDAWKEAFVGAGFKSSRFFGEVMLDGFLCLYIYSPVWNQVSLNMMFLARR